MKRRLCLALWAAGTVTGCLIPPDPVNDPNNPGGAGGTSGTGGPPGTGGGVMPGPAPKGAWVPVTGNLAGLPSECGNLGYVSAKPDEDMLIVGVALHGLWKGTSASTEWAPLGPGAGFSTIKNRTATIVYDPANPRTFWQTGAYGPCAYKTTDHGETFTQLGDARHCDSLSIDFTDPERRTMLAGGHESRELLRSVDGGNTWTDVGKNLPPDTGFTGYVLTLSAQLHLVGTWSSANAGIFRSTDGGATWTRVFMGAIRSRPLVTSDRQIYFVMLHREGNFGLVRSADQGVTWTRVAGSELIYSTEEGLIELPDGKFVAQGRDALFISESRGATWRQLTPNFPWESYGAAYSRHRNAVYIWRWDCNATDNPVSADSIMRWDFQ